MDYTLTNESDAGGTFEELALRRVTSVTSDDTEHPISITIPENINFNIISTTTSSGNINLKNCSGKNVISKTQSGDIVISGGFATNIFAIETNSGNTVISNFDANKDGIDLKTKSGTITFNGQKYNENDFKNETKSDAEYNAWYDSWYDTSYSAGDISEAKREAREIVRKAMLEVKLEAERETHEIIREALVEAHREAHPGISYEDCPKCHSFN